ncbi:MAG: hypothetical protein ACQCN4_13090 [Candidatus Bathyarchaeia archaeon]
MKEKAFLPTDDKVVVEEVVLFPEEVVKLELIKSHLGVEKNTEAIKALIVEKCDAIKLAEEKQRNRRLKTIELWSG